MSTKATEIERIKEEALARARGQVQERSAIVKQDVVAKLLELCPPERRQRMQTALLQALEATPKLMDCSTESLRKAVYDATLVGLEVGTPAGHAYILPYKDSAKFMIGYQGYLELLRRTGDVKHVSANVVFENDTFNHVINDGLDSVHHIPADLTHEQGRRIGVYAIITMTSGARYVSVLRWSDVEATRKRSPSGELGPWASDLDAMAKKTAVHRACKLAPLAWTVTDDTDTPAPADLQAAIQPASSLPELPAVGDAPEAAPQGFDEPQAASEATLSTGAQLNHV